MHKGDSTIEIRFNNIKKSFEAVDIESFRVAYKGNNLKDIISLLILSFINIIIIYIIILLKVNFLKFIAVFYFWFGVVPFAIIPLIYSIAYPLLQYIAFPYIYKFYFVIHLLFKTLLQFFLNLIISVYCIVDHFAHIAREIGVFYAEIFRADRLAIFFLQKLKEIVAAIRIRLPNSEERYSYDHMINSIKTNRDYAYFEALINVQCFINNKFIIKNVFDKKLIEFSFFLSGDYIQKSDNLDYVRSFFPDLEIKTDRISMLDDLFKIQYNYIGTAYLAKTEMEKEKIALNQLKQVFWREKNDWLFWAEYYCEKKMLERYCKRRNAML